MKNQNEFIAFGKNIRRMREDNGLTKKEMSKQLGIGVCSLTMIERGILPERPSCDIIERIKDGFGQTPKQMFLPPEE